MDRYVLCIVCSSPGQSGGELKCAEGLRIAGRLYELLKENCRNSVKSELSYFPACSLTGIPVLQKSFFAIQVINGFSQFCIPEWEEIICPKSKSNTEEKCSSPIQICENAVQSLKEAGDDTGSLLPADIFEDAAESLHQLSDKLPPPGKALVDVILMSLDDNTSLLKEYLPVIGSLKHMKEWHFAKITFATNDAVRWQRHAAYLSAQFCDLSSLESFLDLKEIWRGSIHIHQKKFTSDIRFSGFSLKRIHRMPTSSLFSLEGSDNLSVRASNKNYNEVFHYYKPVLELVQLLQISDLPLYFYSGMEFEITVSSKVKPSHQSNLLLDQLCTLQGKVGAVFSLSCTVSTIAIPSASQLSSRKWKEFIIKKPKSLSGPCVELKGEHCKYFLLVQGNGNGTCKARLIHSANQLNGAAAISTINGLLKDKVICREDVLTKWIDNISFLNENHLLQREDNVAQLQEIVLKDYLRNREENGKPAYIQMNDLKKLWMFTKEKYMESYEVGLPKTTILEWDKMRNNPTEQLDHEISHPHSSDLPEKSALPNLERIAQTMRMNTMLTLSTESILGPRNTHRAFSTQLDAKELLKYFTPEGLPVVELQPLEIHKGENTFQPLLDLTPRKLQRLSFKEATTSHYHGIEFCLDEQRALERDKAFAKLQSRLIKFETHTTCSKESCVAAFALSPVPSPAVLSEPGSVPDGEIFQSEHKTEMSKQKCTSEGTEGIQMRKRFAKSASTDSLISQSSSNSSGLSHLVSAPQYQKTRSITSNFHKQQHIASLKSTAKQEHDSLEKAQESKKENPKKESRSQKHTKMLEEVVAKTLKHHGITGEHSNFSIFSQRLFEICKLYLKQRKLAVS
ncbi:mdm2-binding protein [Polypterus senegalus]|uniref:mdm2-binding protein n=1 Tax=Polypterus senegalus TaxID=55291 RepID=UPI001966008A|nr:mdm2-binding protein [Polypterus senegalus]